MVELNGTLIAQIVNFLILVGILAKFAYKPLMQALADRQNKIDMDLDSAERDKQEAEQLKIGYQEQLRQARVQAQAIVEKAEKLAEESKEAILQEARVESARILKTVQEEIARERAVALVQLKGEVVALSIAAAAKIIEKNIDIETNANLVASFIEKLDAQKNGVLPC